MTPKTDIRAAPQSPPVGDVTLGLGRSCLDTRHSALTWLSAYTTHGTNVMGMYTAFRSMMVVSLWLSPRCAKRGSRLCGGRAFLSIAGNAPPQRKPSPWRVWQVPCPRETETTFMIDAIQLPATARLASAARERRSQTDLDDHRRPLGSSL